MRIHHLNCGTMCPFGGRLWDGFSPVLGAATLVCHCLLIEAEDSLVLVDTGFGLDDVRQPQRLNALFRAASRVRLSEADTARRQVEKLGFSADDVRDIILTHLDFDHAGGIGDFPQATVHVMAAEFDAASQQRTAPQRRRYCPAQWAGPVTWQRYSVDGERWFGFDCVRGIVGLHGDIAIVPLAGHTPGHCGVAVRAAEGWLLHAGDAYFFRGEMDPTQYNCTPMLRLYQQLMAADNGARLRNQQRLRQLRQTHGRNVRLCCAHDAEELADLQAADAQIPAAPQSPPATRPRVLPIR